MGNRRGIIGILIIIVCFSAFSITEAGFFPRLFGTDEPDLPKDPVERAAILGLYDSFKDSTMFEMEDAKIIRVQPMIPTEAFVESHDPKELYCVCCEFYARYKVPWTTMDESDWKRTVRNILVMQTKGGYYMALKPSGICPAHCQ